MDDANDELLIRLLLANGLDECDDAVARIQTLKAERDRFAERHERHLILGAEVRARAEKAEAELADLRAKLAVAVEALDYLVRAFDRVVGNSNHFYENVHRRDIHLDVNEGATIKCVADCRAAIEEAKK